MIHSIHTLSINKYILFEETKNIKYLMRFKFMPFLFKKGFDKLESDLLERFGGDKDVNNNHEKRIYYHYKIIHYRMMYYILKHRSPQEILDAFKLEFRQDFDKSKLDLITKRMSFFNDKYRELVYKEPKEISTKKKTLNDEITTIETILGITIDRSLPISVINAYRERVQEKIKSINNG